MNTPRSGTKNSDIIHVSVPMDRELHKVLAQISFEEDRSKASILRTAWKKALAVSKPEVFMECAKKGLFTMALIGSVMGSIAMEDFKRMRGRFTVRPVTTVRCLREAMA